jgi:hypothetical protein
MIPGNYFIACGCGQSGQPACPLITDVADDAHLTISQPLSCDPSQAGTASYNGNFINPVQDLNPHSNATGFPGGYLDISSNQGKNGIVWVIAPNTTNSQGAQSDVRTITEGTLFAYRAKPWMEPRTTRSISPGSGARLQRGPIALHPGIAGIGRRQPIGINSGLRKHRICLAQSAGCRYPRNGDTKRRSLGDRHSMQRAVFSPLGRPRGEPPGLLASAA